MKKKINILLGSSGFISSYFLKSKFYKDKNFACIDRKKNHYLNNHFFFKSDLSNKKKLKKILINIGRKYNINEIWHFAANSDIQKSSQNCKIDFKNTFLTTYNLIQNIIETKINVKKIIFASSSAIYGPKENCKIRENIGNLMPISNYGSMKLCSESILYSFAHLKNIKCFIFRFPNVVGPHLTHGLIYDLIKKIKKNKNILKILGNGYQKKQYLHVDDLINAMNFIVKKKKFKDNLQIFNVSGIDDGIEVRKIVEKFVSLNNLKPKIYYEKKRVGWMGDIASFRYDISKIKKQGWKPKFNSIESIIKCIKENKLEKKSNS